MGAERKEASTLLPEALNRKRGRNTGSIPQRDLCSSGPGQELNFAIRDVATCL